MANVFLGAFPPVVFLAVCLVLAILNYLIDAVVPKLDEKQTDKFNFQFLPEKLGDAQPQIKNRN